MPSCSKNISTLLPRLKHLLQAHVGPSLCHPPEVKHEQNLAVVSTPSESQLQWWLLCSPAKVLPAARSSPMSALMGKEEEPGCCEAQVTAPVSELLQQSLSSWWSPSPSVVLAELSRDRVRTLWIQVRVSGCHCALRSSPIR